MLRVASRMVKSTGEDVTARSRGLAHVRWVLLHTVGRCSIRPNRAHGAEGSGPDRGSTGEAKPPSTWEPKRIRMLDMEGIVAKRKADPYSPQTVWYKVKNPAYTQAEGRGDLFHKPR
jgi:hypothetical protein